VRRVLNKKKLQYCSQYVIQLNKLTDTCNNILQHSTYLQTFSTW